MTLMYATVIQFSTYHQVVLLRLPHGIQLVILSPLISSLWLQAFGLPLNAFWTSLLVQEGYMTVMRLS